MKKILIMAGGTGGHVFPGIAVAHELSASGEFEVLWLGTAERMEARLVPQHGFKIAFIKVRGIRRNGILRKLGAPFMIVRAVWEALGVVRRFKPDVVLGLGGYASGPGGIAAWLSRIPLVLHEQNAAPGFTNRILARIADRVLLGFPGAMQGDKVSFVGNPVRRDVIALRNKLPRDFSGDVLRVSIVGGSLGAQVFNENLPLAISLAQKQGAKLEVTHQTGRGNCAPVEAQYKSLGCLGVKVSDFIDDMASLYENTHIIICRAGALTVAEVTASGVPAVFVPLPSAVDDHQTKNAKVLAEKNAAVLMPQNDFNAEKLSTLLIKFYQDRSLLTKLSENCSGMYGQDAAMAVADVCRLLAESSTDNKAN